MGQSESVLAFGQASVQASLLLQPGDGQSSVERRQGILGDACASVELRARAGAQQDVEGGAKGSLGATGKSVAQARGLLLSSQQIRIGRSALGGVVAERGLETDVPVRQLSGH